MQEDLIHQRIHEMKIVYKHEDLIWILYILKYTRNLMYNQVRKQIKYATKLDTSTLYTQPHGQQNEIP